MVVVERNGMETTYTSPQMDTSVLGVIRTLLLIQGGIAVMSTLETLLAAAAFGPLLAPIVVLTSGAAFLTLMAARGIVRRSARARKTAIWLEGFVLAFAVVDFLLAILLAKRGLELVPVLTRIVLPVVIIRLLRRRQVRAEFGLGPTRRQRRKDRKS